MLRRKYKTGVFSFDGELEVAQLGLRSHRAYLQALTRSANALSTISSALLRLRMPRVCNKVLCVQIPMGFYPRSERGSTPGDGAPTCEDRKSAGSGSCLGEGGRRFILGLRQFASRMSSGEVSCLLFFRGQRSGG